MVHSEIETVDLKLSLNSFATHDGPDLILGSNDKTTPEERSRTAEDGDRKSKGVDVCWSWFVLFVSLFGTTVCGCSYSLFGLLYNDFIVAFGTDTATAGWIGSMHVGCGNMAAVFLGVAIDRFGCRSVCMAGSMLASAGYFLSFFATHIAFIYLSFGIMAGIGMGMIVMASIIATQRCFEKRRAFAGAVATVGFSIGGILSGLVMRYIYEGTTWQGVCVLFAGFILQMTVLAALAFGPRSHLTDGQRREGQGKEGQRKEGLTSESQREKREKSNKCLEYLRLCLEPPVLMFLLANFMVHIGVNTLYQHTPNRALSLGITPSEIAIWPMTSAMANVLAKIAGGAIANLPSVNRLLFYSVSVFLSGLTQALMPLCLDFTSVIVHGIVQNIFYGCFICLLTTILVDMKGIAHVAKTQALLALFVGSGVLISTPFAGFLYDVTNNYDVTFIVTGVITIMGTFLGLLSNYFHKRSTKNLDPSNPS